VEFVCALSPVAAFAQTNASPPGSQASQTNRFSQTTQTRQNQTAATNPDGTRDQHQRAAEIRTACINGRRCVCGKVIQIVPEGLIVESGYTALMEPPFTGSWVIPAGALVNRDPKLLERNEPASACIGTVLLIDFPKRPPVKLYDFVLLQAYPAGDYLYRPLPGVEKPIRKFAGGLETAVKLKLANEK
jgi:hypothetical protein